MDILSNLSQGLNQAFFPGHREVRVRGWEEAEKYPLPRDCEAVLLDADPKTAFMNHAAQQGRNALAQQIMSGMGLSK